MLSEPQCPLVRLALELALEPELARIRVQVLELQVQVAELARLES